ncbi:MAG TPA: rod shape-determining protein RodA, partial [Spirochaetota bacterium]|nr:rod shape-determining protein RodA [Spirochaetota bacterium]
REWMGAGTDNILINFYRSGKSAYVLSLIILNIGLIFYILHLFFVNRIFRRIYIPSFVFSIGLFASVVIQRFLKDYQKKRLLVFLNPDLDPHGSGYNVIQSKIAVGSGGFLGKGFMHGSQTQLGFLPEKSTDFIFSVVAEEWGFIGGLVVLALYAVIIFKGIQIALEAKDKFSSLLATGITAIFLTHLLVNIGMVIGIMPVTGIPLLFLSYGGSSLLMSMIAIGILININIRKFNN